MSQQTWRPLKLQTPPSIFLLTLERLLPNKSLSKQRNISSLVGRYGILTCSKDWNFLYYCLLPLGLSITWLSHTFSGRLIHLKSCQTHGQKKYLPSDLHSQYSPLQGYHHVVLVKPAFFSGILGKVKCFLFLLKIVFSFFWLLVRTWICFLCSLLQLSIQTCLSTLKLLTDPPMP